MVEHPAETAADNILWRDFQAGDKRAYTRLFRTYYKPLFQYGSKIMPERTHVEDAIQELFLELWQRRERLSTPESVKAYLFKSLKFKLIKLRKVNLRWAEALSGENETPEFSYETLLIHAQESHETTQKLAHAMRHLTKRQREAIYLKFYNQMSYEEVSEVMVISYQAARNLIYQSIKVLKGLLASLLFYLLDVKDML